MGCVVASVLGLHGCLVLPTGPYYAPSAPGASAFGSMCGSEARFFLGPRSHLRICGPGNLVVRLHVLTDGASSRTLWLSVRPNDVPVEPLGDAILVRWDGGERRILHRVGKAWLANNGWRELTIDVTDVGDRDFDVLLPPLLVAGRQFDPPSVHFHYRHFDLALFPFNC